MSSNAGDAEARALLQRHVSGKLNYLLQRQHRVFGGGAEGTVTLSAIAPHSATNPLARHAFSHCVDCARTIAVGNNTRIWHAHAERVLPFFDVAGIYA